MEKLPVERVFILVLGALMLLVLASIFLVISGGFSRSKATSEVSNVDHERNYVIVRTGHHGAYGRIVFDWRKPVRYKERLKGDLLSISMFETVPIDVSHVAYQLRDYITSASTRTYKSHVHVDLRLRRNTVTAVSQWNDLVVVDMAELE